jgi:hypothetical protein
MTTPEGFVDPATGEYVLPHPPAASRAEQDTYADWAAQPDQMSEAGGSTAQLFDHEDHADTESPALSAGGADQRPLIWDTNPSDAPPPTAAASTWVRRSTPTVATSDIHPAAHLSEQVAQANLRLLELGQELRQLSVALPNLVDGAGAAPVVLSSERRLTTRIESAFAELLAVLDAELDEQNQRSKTDRDATRRELAHAIEALDTLAREQVAVTDRQSVMADNQAALTAEVKALIGVTTDLADAIGEVVALQHAREDNVMGELARLSSEMAALRRRMPLRASTKAPQVLEPGNEA